MLIKIHNYKKAVENSYLFLTHEHIHWSISLYLYHYITSITCQ